MKGVIRRSFLLNPVIWNQLTVWECQRCCQFKNAYSNERLLSTTPETLPTRDLKIPPKLLKRKNDAYTIPPLTTENLKGISAITGISIGMFHISWIKFSIDPGLSILEWNAKLLPDDFRTKSSEPDILKYAYYFKRALPQSDLYVMETFSIRGKELNEKLSEIHLSSMLTVLLNGLDRDPDHRDKVLFQKKNVINSLYDLLVGSERVSSISVVEDFLAQMQSKDQESENKQTEGDNSEYDLSSVRISPKCLDLYSVSTFEKKEDLATVFLLGLSFVHVNILKNEAALEKLNKRKTRSVLRMMRT